jgi:acylphosphatase
MSAEREERARIEVTVRGVVQGVGFRYFVLRRANRLGLDGWVANERDGSVRCVAEGDPADLGELLEVIRRGPPGSRVDDVAVRRSAATGTDSGFRVRPSAHPGD